MIRLYSFNHIDEFEIMDKDKKLMEDNIDFKKISRGMVLRGEVISSYKNEVVVNINYFCDGIIRKEECINDEYSPGEAIDVYVLSLDDGEGNVLLSEKRATYKNAVNEINKAYKDGTTLLVDVKEEISAGVVCNYKGVRGFIPKSKLSLNKFNLKDYEKSGIEVKVIELDTSKNKVVFSRKDIELELEEEKKRSILNSLKVGDKFEGVIKNIKDYGVFVDIGGVQGLIHKSELSYKHTFNINDMFKVGDKVLVYILDFNKDIGKVSMTMKDPNYDPFKENNKYLKEGDIYDVEVLKIISSGVIVSLNEYITGFIHISEISDENININKTFNVGDKIKAKIIYIDNASNKISLSYKQAFDEEEKEGSYIDEDTSNSTLGDVFKDIFSKLK